MIIPYLPLFNRRPPRTPPRTPREPPTHTHPTHPPPPHHPRQVDYPGLDKCKTRTKPVRCSPTIDPTTGAPVSNRIQPAPGSPTRRSFRHSSSGSLGPGGARSAAGSSGTSRRLSRSTSRSVSRTRSASPGSSLPRPFVDRRSGSSVGGSVSTAQDDGAGVALDGVRPSSSVRFDVALVLPITIPTMVNHVKIR